MSQNDLIIAPPANNLVPTAASATPFALLEAMAFHAVKSRMFGVENDSQALMLFMLADSEGIPPIQAVRRYHIINNRPVMKADAMLAEFQARGGVVRWETYEDDRVTGVFVHPSSPEPLPVTWDLEMAKKAGLLQKQGPWHQYPRQMLRARCISEGVRTVLPGVCVGIYTEEEARDMPSDAPVLAQQEAPLRTSARPALPARQSSIASAYKNAAPEPQDAVTPPPPTGDPKAEAIKNAMFSFADAARDLALDVDVDGQPGTPSKQKLVDLFPKVRFFKGASWVPSSPEHWNLAKAALLEYTEAQEQAGDDPFAETVAPSAEPVVNALEGGL